METDRTITPGGIDFPFKRENPIIDMGVTFGFLKDRNGMAAIANRIFETQLYDIFLTEMAVNNKMYIETGLRTGIRLLWQACFEWKRIFEVTV